MNCRNLLSVVILVAGSFTTFAQSNLLNAKTPSEIGKKTAAQLISDNDKPLVYGYVHDRDVLMGKAIWETIDLDERINFPLYYPIDTANIGKDRRSLFDVILKNIKQRSSIFSNVSSINRIIQRKINSFVQINGFPNGFTHQNVSVMHITIN